MKVGNRLFLLGVMGMVLLVPTTSQAQDVAVPECGVTFPIDDPYCVYLCEQDPTNWWCEPVEPTRDPIVLVPGITVSQNKKVLYEDEPSEVWKFAFGYNVYKGLINKLETAGYEQGVDLFVAHYDWRNPAAHNATTYLKPIISQAKESTGSSKVDVIAHSFGGVVTRGYVQGSDYGNDIDQLITLGSPHEGAADAYVAWEGGVFPVGWDFFIKRRVANVENALKDSRNQPDIQRPESFRAFFPSLRDMLPLDDFVLRDNEPVSVGDLAEHNDFLSNLRDTINVIADQGINLATIASTGVETLGQIALSGERTPEDELLNRWRDGRANPLPPPLNSTAGDARVLLSSAHLEGTNITLEEVEHHKLPDAAQDQVFELLGLEETPSFFSDFPEKIFGITILSPIEATIVGPHGEVLSKDQNTFGADHAEYDDDPNDPDDPIDITIADPPPGNYTITYTGTGAGEYTIITTYADDNETVASIKDGTTTLGKVETTELAITEETTSLIDDTDYRALLSNIAEQAYQAQRERLIKGNERADITKLVTHALNDVRLYEQRLARDRTSSAYDRLESYYEEITELERVLRRLARRPALEAWAREMLEMVENIQQHSPPLP